MVVPGFELDLQDETTLDGDGDQDESKEEEVWTCGLGTYHVVDVLSNDGALFLVAERREADGDFVTGL